MPVRSRWRSILLPSPDAFLLRLAVLVGLIPLAGWLGGRFWLADLANHFQPQYAVVLALLTAGLLLRKRWRSALVAGAFLPIPLVRIAPCFLPADKPSPTASTVVKVAAFNVLTHNSRHAEAVGWTREVMPDVIYFPEADEAWGASLRSLAASHPHAVEHFIPGNFGFVFRSRFPILRHEILPCGSMELPLLKAVIAGPQGEFIFYGAHPVPPVTPFWAEERDAFLQALADDVTRETRPLVVAGDLNATRWSHGMKPLWRAGLVDTALGRGVGGTWMRSSVVFSIGIDHVLFRAPGGGCRARWIGPDLGSDHRAVVAEIAW